ncbi:hypothetical protein [Pseudomonas sp. SORGH_AS_0199]|uniref:hypothetical protein n=1 Tax=Pseudomonas sp. SORGH_AS_0199 TaxID=3041761 RepID=UPI00286B8883|nr:hypothetical protein [Pseudomonas sp. SORGH_AS_0199]
MSVRTKLFSGFTVLIILTLAIAYAGWNGIQALGRRGNLIEQFNQPQRGQGPRSRRPDRSRHRETAGSSTELANLSLQLQELTSRFRV